MPDWICPKCERRFARRNQSHSCARHTAEEHLRGVEQSVLEVYEAFADVVAGCGPYELASTRSQIGFRVKRIFCGVVPRESALDGYLDLPRKVSSSRFDHVADYTDKLWVHHLTLRSTDEVDAEFAGWIQESYRVGTGDYVEERAR